MMPTFNDWYSLYPKKKARQAAEKAWNKLTPDQQQQALEAIPLQVQEWKVQNQEKRFMLHPASWLNGHRFEDEFDTEPVKESQGEWWRSQSGIQAKADELGRQAKRGESQDAWVTALRHLDNGLRAA